MRKCGVVGKICHYIVSTKQKSSRIRRSRALNGGPEGRAGGKIRHFLRKVVEKVGERDRETDEHIGIRSTRAFREPCNGGFSPRTPIIALVVLTSTFGPTKMLRHSEMLPSWSIYPIAIARNAI